MVAPAAAEAAAALREIQHAQVILEEKEQAARAEMELAEKEEEKQQRQATDMFS